jgi:pyruvate/2-oxoglutarate dehydrogenase complex dihydrolipoamide dehydrogenase (E3) component
MVELKKYPYIVIGAGAAGLVIASGLAKANKKVLLIERSEFGGDCTNLGCIPSKALIAAAEVVHGAIKLGKMQIESKSQISCEDAIDYVHRVVDKVREKEEPHELQKEGVEILRGHARFIGERTIEVKANGKTLTCFGKRIILATGSKPRIPPIEGIDSVDYLTNENIFNLKAIPKRLAVVGAGAIGCELAQAFRRLGSEVSLIHPHHRLLDREEPIAGNLIKQLFENEGIKLYTKEHLKAVKKEGGTLLLTLQKTTLESDALLIATGRVARTDGLDLERAAVASSERGIITNDYGETSAKRVYAIGDVAGSQMFSHTAEASGRALLFNFLAPWPFRKKVKLHNPAPHVTFTAPEVAGIGMTEEEAIKRFGKNKVASYYVPFDEVDRAICQGATEGFVHIVTKKWSSKILGATIAASRAGEMLMEVGVAMAFNIPLRKLSHLLHPYPIYNLAIRKAADQWLTKTILRKK